MLCTAALRVQLKNLRVCLLAYFSLRCLPAFKAKRTTPKGLWLSVLFKVLSNSIYYISGLNPREPLGGYKLHSKSDSAKPPAAA